MFIHRSIDYLCEPLQNYLILYSAVPELYPEVGSPECWKPEIRMMANKPAVAILQDIEATRISRCHRKQCVSPACDGIATHLVGLRAALLALPSAIMMGLVATAAVLLAYR